MKILLIDIETAPNTAYVWGLYKQNIGINQIVRTGRVMCFAAKWYGNDVTGFHSEVGGKKAHEKMVKYAWQYLNEADAVVHYNGSTFDVPTLNKEFLKLGLTPPSPYQQIDLIKVARKQFRFASNKLDHLLKELDLKGKVEHEGFEMWVDCMNGDPEAWECMEEYNRGDIEGLEPLYERMLPWITNHPNSALYGSFQEVVCTNCGGAKLQRRGYRRTKVGVYRQFQCQSCGTWMRERTTDLLPEERKGVLVQS